MKPVSRLTILALALALALLGVSCAHNARVGPTDEQPNYRADAIISFGKGVGNEIFYALPKPQRFSWSFAPVIRVPVAPSRGISIAASAGPALLVVLKGETRERPYVSAWLMQTGRGQPDSLAVSTEFVRPCIGEAWIAAFFVDGLGPSPSGPVVLQYSANSVNYRIRIDPRLHTVRAIPALRLARGDVDVDSTLPERRVVSIRLANTLTPMLPVLAWREETGWYVAGNTGHDGNYGIILQGYPDRSPIHEWRLYTLEAPPLC